MSDSQTQPFQPTPSTGTPKRRGGLLAGLLVVLLAAVLLAAAVWYAGGTSAIGQLGGLLSSFVSTPSGGQPAAPKPAAPAPAAVATPSAGNLPPEAQQRMFAEQIDSHEPLAALVDGRIVSFETGIAHNADASATLPLTATFKDGSTIKGTVSLRKYNGTWYFFSLVRSGGQAPNPSAASTVGFDSNVVATITQQQAEPSTQEMLTQGLVDGGYRTVKVESVTMGPRTATVDVSMADGTEPATEGRLVCISKTDGATTYWFVARFEKR
ncbi:MAG: hypothetical protein P4L93_12185 [Coriobacteriia bacterium]|nr:hypothetical protein [Coriobacteriia bacterium]